MLLTKGGEPLFYDENGYAQLSQTAHYFMEKETPYVIEMRDIVKDFPGIRANDHITLQLKKGEIHALLGENGAGKSTLMSVLFGLYQPDSGSIYKDGKEIHIKSPNDANDLRIGMVHQHFKLVECFTVLDNIILGDEDSKAGWVSKKAARKKCNEIMLPYIIVLIVLIITHKKSGCPKAEGIPYEIGQR